MSNDEEMMIRGRIVTAHAEANKRLVLLHDEARRIGKQLEYVAKCIQHPLPHVAATIEVEHLAALDGDKVQRLLAQIEEAHNEVASTRDQLSKLGLLT